MSDQPKAFPHIEIRGYHRIYHRGMDLRDYFAARALNGLLSSSYPTAPPATTSAARMAYEYADAMLAARKKERT